MLRNMLGPNFDSILEQGLTHLFDIFGPFSFSKDAETTIVIVSSANIESFKPTPQN